MLTLEQIARTAYERGEAINLVFEARLVDLVNTLHDIGVTLSSAGIDYELVGGMAVVVHVEEADPDHSMLTRDVDILVNRSDLDRVVEAAAAKGFRYRHAAGLDMLTFGEMDRTRRAVHLLFTGEIVRPTQPMPNPKIAPVRKVVFGEEVMVAPVADLLGMKLSAYRFKDRVHVQVMDAVGLITPEIENSLTDELRHRLNEIREAEPGI